MKPSQQDQPSPQGGYWPTALPPPRRGWWFLTSPLAMLLFLILFLPVIPAVAGQTIFTTQVPATPDASDGVPYELGMKFQSAEPGLITAIRYWKAPSEGGTHTGRIWDAAGNSLGTITFTSETASGWQTQNLGTPVSITANTTYVVSVNVNSHYAATVGGLAASITNPPLSTVVGENGVFGSPGSFPTTPSPNNANYFRDVVFTPQVASSTCIDLKKSVSVNGSTGPFVRNSVTTANPNPGAANSLIASIPGTGNVPDASVDIPTAFFGGTPVFYQFEITNCGTVDLYNVRLDDCIDRRSVGADGFLVGGVGAGGEGNCEQPRMIPASPQRIVANKLAPGQSVTVTSASFADDPINPNSSNFIDICNTYGGSRTSGIVRNDAEAEADADTNGDGYGDKFVFFDELNLVQCKEPPPKAKLGDRIWEDLDGNGIQDCSDTNNNGILGDAGDTGPECGKSVPGATVNLRTPDGQGNCTGAVQQTTTTDGQGFYLFDNLTPVSYCVEFVKPNICDGTTTFFTQANAGGNVAVDSDANPTTGRTGTVTLAAGQTNRTVDAGVYCPAKLGDRIWLDNNQDGDQNCSGVDPNNPGQVIPNGGASCSEPTFAQPITVSLTDCAGGNALDIAGNPVSPITTSTGLYLFGNLKPGRDYCVQFTRPAGYNCTTPNATGVGYQVNSDGSPNNAICATGPVTLMSGGDDRSWDLGLFQPPPNCDLTVKKTCEVLPPPPSTEPFVCSNAKPLDVLTMINGSNLTASNIRVYRDKYDPKNPNKNLMYILGGPFAPGTEVAAEGYAAANAALDVDWVFTASDGKTYISRFHRSCSDPDMNGPEDCGKPQGNAKSTSTSLQGLPVLNTWALEGLAGNGLALNCTADPVPPTFPQADACITTAQNLPSCLTQGKPKELVFKYTVTAPNSLCTISNGQSGKATCSVTGAFDPAQPASVLAAGSSDLNKDVYTVVPTSVSKDGSITVTFNGSDFKADSYFRLSQGNNRVDLKIHTSCSQVLAVGDVFGPLTLVGFNGATGGTPVRYGYELLNKGNPVTVTSIVDDKLGSIYPIDSSNCGTGLPNLATNASVRCTKEGAVTQTTTNTVTVNAKLANGTSCPTTDSLTVTVAPPPPPVALCDALKPIDGIVLEFDQSVAGKAIASVDQYRDKYDPNNPAKNFMKTYTDITGGDEVNFDGYAAAGAVNDVDLLIKFVDGTRAVSRFHRSCSDNDMNDLADCGKPQGNGKENSSSLLNTWILRNLLGNGKQLGCQ